MKHISSVGPTCAELAHRFPFVHKWHTELRSDPEYIERQLIKASRDHAPANATYERDGKWNTTDDITNLDLRKSWRLEWRECDQRRADCEPMISEIKRELEIYNPELCRLVLGIIRHEKAHLAHGGQISSEVKLQGKTLCEVFADEEKSPCPKHLVDWQAKKDQASPK